MMKKRMVAVGMILLVITCVGCSSLKREEKEKERFQAEFLTLFDTATQIVGYASTEEEFKSQVQIVYDELEIYHKLYDIYTDYEGINNIKTINDNAGIAPVVVDEKIIDLLKMGKEMYQQTDGKINIAFGSVLTIWHEYRTFGIENPSKASLPSLEELEEAANHVDIDQMILDEEENTVFLQDPDMSIDVGSVGKGYAVEQAAQKAIEAGVDSMLLSVGGNVRAIGVKGTMEQWRVGIQNPYTGTDGGYIQKVNLEDVALVTSGDYQRYYEVEGKKYHHIIDTKTLYPATNFPAVSILCEDSGKADALSTAVFNMPYEEGLAFVESLEGVEAMWMLSDKTLAYSSGFENYIAE